MHVRAWFRPACIYQPARMHACICACVQVCMVHACNRIGQANSCCVPRLAGGAACRWWRISSSCIHWPSAHTPRPCISLQGTHGRACRESRPIEHTLNTLCYCCGARPGSSSSSSSSLIHHGCLSPGITWTSEGSHRRSSWSSSLLSPPVSAL